MRAPVSTAGRLQAPRALVCFAALACLPAFGADDATKTVEIARFAFVPNALTVEPGTRVRWVNHDETPHTVRSQGPNPVLKSPGLDLNDSFEFVFRDEGDYAYLCTVHPMMTGVVHVRRR